MDNTLVPIAIFVMGLVILLVLYLLEYILKIVKLTLELRNEKLTLEIHNEKLQYEFNERLHDVKEAQAKLREEYNSLVIINSNNSEYITKLETFVKQHSGAVPPAFLTKHKI